jgi:hypothetical protein
MPTTDSNEQERLSNLLKDPKFIGKIAEGSMDKRRAVMYPDSNEELRAKIDELIPCIQCDGSGAYAVDDGYGEPEAEQCQYCYELRFPAIDKIMSLFTTHIHTELEDLKSITRDYKNEYPDADFDDFLGIIAGKQAALRLAHYLRKDKE